MLASLCRCSITSKSLFEVRLQHLLRSKCGRNIVFVGYRMAQQTCFCTDKSGVIPNISAGRRTLPDGPNFHHFLTQSALTNDSSSSPASPDNDAGCDYMHAEMLGIEQRRVYMEVYGCQMNFADADVVLSILSKAGYCETRQIEDADAILVLTCSIREGAERRLMKRLHELSRLSAAGSCDDGHRVRTPARLAVLGCMAERLKQRLFEQSGGVVDVVAGPDSYRHLPRLLAAPEDQPTAMHVQLSLDETYADVRPTRRLGDIGSPAAFVSVMRGCDNMCTYCVVPFTRGRERTRPLASIVDEVRHLVDSGIREVTLLGQNVNSYRDASESAVSNSPIKTGNMSRGFSTVYKPRVGGRRFAELLAAVSDVDPELRVRFTSPHPKDFPDELIQLIAERPNICSCLHLPAQAGNNRVLQSMGRGYTREAYLDLVQLVRKSIPGVYLTSDFIGGFCGETDAEFEDTLSLMREVRYDVCFMYAYSMREKTRAYHRLRDNVPHWKKTERRRRMVDLSARITLEKNGERLGREELVLIDSRAYEDPDTWFGRNDGNVKVIVHPGLSSLETDGVLKIERGDYLAVEVVGCNFDTLYARPLRHTSLQDFSRRQSVNQVADFSMNELCQQSA